jgi:CubicO group peptidase (beta-lactamase class C family)
MEFKNRFENSCVKTRLVGASAVIVKDEEIEEEVSFGFQSLESKEPVTPNTIFRIASISKIIVAMTVMTLVEEGKLSIGDDIGSILGFPIRNPHFPDTPITIEMLMTQTSSITDGFDDEDPLNEHEICGYNGVNGTSWNVGLRDLLIPNEGKYYTSGTWDRAKPGTKFIYSNFGCGILACICEAVTGEYFTDYAARRILKPLQLDASFRASEIIAKDRIATLYNRTGNPENPYKISRSKDSFILSGYPRFPLAENYRGPAGGLFISMHDLSKIMRVLMNDGSCYGVRILKKETVEMMLQMHWFGHDDPTYRSKGLQLKLMDDFDNRLFAGHTGYAYGVVSLE